MKWYEYIISRTFLKITDEKERREQDSYTSDMKEKERFSDKGSLRYNKTMGFFDFIEPKKNVHFVTTEISITEEKCRMIISKTAKSIRSEPFDYPWDAESDCSFTLDYYRDLGFTTEVKREVPILIADSDICCPFCLNSSSIKTWAINSYKQEMIDLPNIIMIAKDLDGYKTDLTIKDIETNKYWCPICNNGIDNANLLILKNFEWKAKFLKEENLAHHTSPHIEAISQKEERKPMKKKAVSFTDPREIIQKPLTKILKDQYQGLVAKGTQTVRTKSGLIEVSKWVSLKNELPMNFKLNSEPFTTYKVNENHYIRNKRDKNEYPIIYVPIDELLVNSYDERDEEKVSEVKKMFHKGELLEPIPLTVDKRVIRFVHLAIFSFEMGLTHVPVIISGEFTAKRILEKTYKEQVKTIQAGEAPMIKQVADQQPHAYGTFVKKKNKLYRTEAYIEWGNSEEILGTVIMLNPGSASLKINTFNDEVPVHNELKIDPTMKSLIQMLEAFHNETGRIKGRLYIYNLFPLQNPKMSKAMNELEELWLENEPLVKFLPKSKDQLVKQVDQSPWVLLGWGCGPKTPNLTALIDQWLDIINQTKTPVLGKKGKSPLDYHHPRPQLQTKQIEYQLELKRQFDQLTKDKRKQNYIGIQDVSWKRHLENFQPAEDFYIGPYRLLLFNIDINEKGYYLQYNYRLICFVEGLNVPILALNHESSHSKTSYFGASFDKKLLNLGPASKSMTLIEFRKWALQNISYFIEDIDTKEVYEKMNQNLPPTNLFKKPYDELMEKRIEQFAKQIIEFQDRYEYCFIPSYAEKYGDFNIHGVPIDGVNTIIVELKDELKLLSVEFDKEHFTIEQIIIWLQQMGVYIGNKYKANHFIEDGYRIINAFKFTGHIMALYIKGKEILELDTEELEEITEDYGLKYVKVDPKKSKGLNLELTILLNYERVLEIPRLEFDRENDRVISNGNLLRIDYIDAYNNGIGFYRYDDLEPIVVILDQKTTVEINIFKTENNHKICNIEHHYIIDLDVIE
ncbi:hypothetical protein [Sporosarcina sp. G11-34]|uniref:hypothetical protein n=1 Tax=Sporosarcina sp. G11-34 TaxID=2849605 RepID=UPI0022A8D440|nr:hypothetical protein [Sporosarcina sp. G11-34]MCZ2260649.1 DUF1643 domain-containing protein [Sporosarcina sp. G11-34]